MKELTSNFDVGQADKCGLIEIGIVEQTIIGSRVVHCGSRHHITGQCGIDNANALFAVELLIELEGYLRRVYFIYLFLELYCIVM